MRAKEVPSNSYIQPNQYVKFDQIIKDLQANLWWIRFKYQAKGSSNKNFYMPVGPLEDKNGKILKEKNLWGKLSKVKRG